MIAVAFITLRSMVQPQFIPSTPDRRPSAKPFSLKILAEGLKLNTLQGIAIVQDSVIVPTIEGELLRVGQDGKISVLANLLNADLGIPFAIAPNDSSSVVVTTSTYDPLHFLVRVGLDGSISPIVDLSEFNTPYGAPFGVAVEEKENYILAGSKDVVSDQGLLYRVKPNAQIEEIRSLVEFGDPLELLLHGDLIIVSMRNGDLLKVQGNNISRLADLKKLGFGVAFGMLLRDDQYVMTTNTRKIIQVDENGRVSVLYDLLPKNVGVPAGIAVWENRLIVSTDGGLLLEIS